MKKIFWLIMILFLSAGVCTVFAQTGTRIIENSGNFSWQPPLNWTVSEFPGLKYRIAFGPTEGGFATNINFVDETFNGTLRSYVDQSIAQFPLFFQDFRLLSQDVFRTNSGIAGEKVVINNNQQGFLLRQIFYFLPSRNDTFFVVTCSVLESAATRYLTVFDESIKTFQLITE